jgi:anti-sigma28 factor (negative regulator of flagellin synthesis)
MRIDPSPLSLAQAIGQTETGETSGKTLRGRDGGGDRVQISAMAAQLFTDPAKLSRLQAAFASGDYHVAPNKIANSIIADGLET